MRSLMIVPTVLAAMCHVPVSAETQTLAPASTWNLDYGDYRCALKRTFGEGEQATVLHLEQTGLGNFYNVLVAGPMNRRARGEEITIRFGPEAAMERGFLKGKYKETKTPFIVMHGVHLAPAPDGDEYEFVAGDIGAERQRAITTVELDYGRGNSLILQTGPLDQAVAAMEKCTQNLVATLGLDEASQEQLASKPEPLDLSTVARKLQQAYPLKMLRDEEDGLVKYRVLVNAEGKPEGCQIAQSSRPASFDDFVCFFIIRELEFEPARNSAGEPVAGIYTGSVRYVID